MSDWRRSSALRLLAGVILFSLLAWEGTKPGYWTFLWTNRAPWRARFATQPDRRDPPYRAFLQRVEKTTQPGSSILILTTNPDWDVQYGFLYFRALYLLESRRVLPILSRDGPPHLERLSTSDFIAAWRTDFHSPLYETIWRTDMASLSRRRR